MKFFYLLLLVILFSVQFVISGCGDKNPTISNKELVSANKINFNQLEVGQTNRYIYFVGEDYRDPSNTNFEYRQDTLIVEVIEKNVDGFVFQEYLLPGSVSLSNNNGILFADSIFTYTVKVSNDSLFISSDENLFYSHLFYHSHLFTSEKTFPLIDISSTLVEIIGWKTTFPHCECYQQGYTKDYEQFGISYNRLNIVVDNVDMQVDGPGYTYVYSMNEGFVRTYSVSWWTGIGHGWDLL